MNDIRTDTEIIELVLRGNQAAFSLLIDRYKKLVFSIALKYIKSREDAEEISQDVFIKAYRALADFKGTSKFSTWLYTIATTTCITFLRKKKIDIYSLDNEKVFAHADNLDSGISANEVEKKSRVQMVNESINLLNAEDAQVISLFYKGEQTIYEIAAIIGKEPNAVKVQLHRARVRLKEKMLKHFSAEVREI